MKNRATSGCTALLGLAFGAFVLRAFATRTRKHREGQAPEPKPMRRVQQAVAEEVDAWEAAVKTYAGHGAMTHSGYRLTFKACVDGNASFMHQLNLDIYERTVLVARGVIQCNAYERDVYGRFYIGDTDHGTYVKPVHYEGDTPVTRSGFMESISEVVTSMTNTIRKDREGEE